MRFIDSRHDPWQRIVGEDGPLAHPAVKPHSLLSLMQWHAVRKSWPVGVAVGVSLPNSADIEVIAPDLARLELVELHFPKWVDGRAYSQARLLRSRYRYWGELRAVGEVLVDMMPMLKRTGFNAVVLRQDQKRASAERALAFFPGYYQGDVNQVRPAFARDIVSELAAHAELQQAEADSMLGHGI